MLVNTFLLLIVFTSFAFSEMLCVAADAHVLAREGGSMDAAAVDALEASVVQSPNDVESRTKLLGYYMINRRRARDTESARMRHVLWLIENAPESEVLGLPYAHLDKILDREAYPKAKKAWLKVFKEAPDNTAALSNASKFFLLHDRDLAEHLLLQGQLVEADNASWPASLGQLYSLGLVRLATGPEKTAAAQKALDQYELAFEKSEPARKDSLLVDLAKTAFEAGQIDKARTYSEQLLADTEDGWNSGNRVHHGNIVLGRIALLDDNVEEAKKRLLAAGNTSGSPQLNSFGPNMLLAKELLERGEKEVVLEYFLLCDKFWESPRRKLDQWIEEVKSGEVPAFGGNLAY